MWMIPMFIGYLMLIAGGNIMKAHPYQEVSEPVCSSFNGRPCPPIVAAEHGGQPHGDTYYTDAGAGLLALGLITMFGS